MSSIKSHTQKTAYVLESEPPAVVDLSSIQASLDAISSRLDVLETSALIPRTDLRTSQSTHPSQDRFAIAEAIADVVFEGLNGTKACTFEPNAKPCDHCSMCSARGF